MKPQGQIIYALTRHVRSSEQAFKMEARIYEAKLATLLLMPIIMSIIALQIGCAENIATLLLLMDQHLIWLLKQRPNTVKNI